jgi:hypothetical protein
MIAQAGRNGRRIDKKTPRACGGALDTPQRFMRLHFAPPSHAWRAAMRHKSAAHMR